MAVEGSHRGPLQGSIHGGPQSTVNRHLNRLPAAHKAGMRPCRSRRSVCDFFQTVGTMIRARVNK
jgi:hypothetical protein